MARSCSLPLSHKIQNSFVPSLCISKASPAFPMRTSTPFPSRFLTHTCFKSKSTTLSVSAAGASFTWDDVLRISQPESLPDDPSDISVFFQKVKICNRGSEKQSEFLPFVIEDQIVGYLHNGFAQNLRRFKDVFIFPRDDSYGGPIGAHVTLHPMLGKPEDRTGAVGDVVKCLGEELIPGIRNEAYGVQMNGYVERDRQKLLWIGKRSQGKATYPGMLDHLVAGGLPHGISCGENLVKECEEEAGIPISIANEAIPVGAVSYMDIDGYRYKRDVLFCYDLKLPESFKPENQDGEVDSFKLIPARHVANVIRRTQFFKPNCSLVIIDFLFRHGYMKPEHFGYLDLLQSLRSGDCS
ncbi:nudix hydrolase 20, chloroplastic-like isoform X2 [Juglans microcarpa x Juglans regia]|uniref:nudix hydrolase 20, chloroplastic-like isoform X2 n=1 Tax=Juglans microcarpa x Juglans regia TaxID=2249226 RepID=UPI001B7E93EF|nr:nudix hydrolase 20, chloroplastic-like isoform X2 [Juglans microcarpa x Juglans regia]